jgi:CHAD domain-containing protein
VRSARSLLVLTRGSFDGEDLNAARHAGARISYLTGRARNLDVFVEHWRELTLELESGVVVHLGNVLSHVNDLRIREYRSILEFTGSEESTEFEREMQRLAGVPSVNAQADQVVKDAIKRINKRVVAVARSVSDLAPDEVLHDARKNLKKLRYSLEMTREHFSPRHHDRFVDLVGDLQNVIGRHQDAVAFANELWDAGRKLADSGSSDTLISIGILLHPIEETRRAARRKSLAKLRTYADDDVQQLLKKLVGSLD